LGQFLFLDVASESIILNECTKRVPKNLHHVRIASYPRDANLTLCNFCMYEFIRLLIRGKNFDFKKKVKTILILKSQSSASQKIS